jgi:hypothetical protein
LSADAFGLGSAAHDFGDRVLYDPLTGRLSYDPDGAGAASPMLVARLGRGLALAADDIFVI